MHALREPLHPVPWRRPKRRGPRGHVHVHHMYVHVRMCACAYVDLPWQRPTRQGPRRHR